MRCLSALLHLLLADGPLIACGSPQLAPPHLPAAYGEYATVDNALVFELPDSGGYIANGQPIDSAALLAVLREVFASRRPGLRAVFVIDNPKRPWAEVDFIRTAALAAGGTVFDAERSGRLPLQGWRTNSGDTIP